MIRNAGPSSSRVRISPNGCLSFIISPNWAGCWLHARPLPRAVRVFDGMTNSCSGPGAQLTRDPPGLSSPHPGILEKLTSRALRNRDLIRSELRLVTRCWGVMRAGQRLTDYLEKFCKSCHWINQPPGSRLGSSLTKGQARTEFELSQG